MRGMRIALAGLLCCSALAAFAQQHPRDGEIHDAAWAYPEPYPEVADIASHAAFYPDRVEITAEG